MIETLQTATNPEKLASIRLYAQMWDDVLRCESAERTGTTQEFLIEQRKITSGILDGFRALEMLVEPTVRNTRKDDEGCFGCVKVFLKKLRE